MEVGALIDRACEVTFGLPRTAGRFDAALGIGIGIAIAIGNRNHAACDYSESPGDLVPACKTDGESDCDPDADSDLML